MKTNNKKQSVFVILLLLLFIVAVPSAMADITGSAHDFSAESWTVDNQICVVCHTPHSGDTASNAPLWNHATTTATFTLYSSSTMNATVSQPGGRSKLCLSCHDGTVALDSFGGNTGGTTISGGALLSTDLGNDHPISITYDSALATADGELSDPSSALSGLGGTIEADMLFSSSMMECSSCHDVHNSAGVPALLVKANTGSDLCLTCHIK